MKRGPLGLKQPEGMTDFLPGRLAALEEAEQKALGVMRAWTYRKVRTPGLEYRDCVEPGADQGDSLYKFFDRDGNILALRPEFTTPIARLAACWCREDALPLRFCYAGPVYRSGDERQREFSQVGAELVGVDSPLADAEVLALAVEVLKALEVQGFRLSLGHNGILEGLMQEFRVGDVLRRELEDGIARKDIVKLETLIRAHSLPPEAAGLLTALPALTGREEVLDALEPWNRILPVRRAAETLRTIYAYLAEFGVQKYVSLDLGILQGFSYYTGAVFEGYLPEVGAPVLDGGRYDGLYADFGFPQPATGFALHLGLILEQAEEKEEEGADVLVYGQSPLKVIKRCRELRRAGKKVEMALTFLPEDEAKQLAAARGIGALERV
ncbi:MAG: ATP phosphoribosyltransferase regulatory subunit [Gracilibacteraceae bacterium]|jgi:ATP phosphoribosyltransferase regulatory subunit|nr:ATP phosphoribosyltransferase regulatory subunit [Gracilibacteraceae bacterium]